MQKSSKAVTLVLVSSAAVLLGYSALEPHLGSSGNEDPDAFDNVADTYYTDANGLDPSTQPGTQPTGSRGSSHTGYYHRSRYGRSSPGFWRPFFGWSRSSGAGSRSTGSHTSRGGFGSSGHAASAHS